MSAASAAHRKISAIALTFPRAEPPRAMHVRLPRALEFTASVRLPKTPDARGGSPRPAESDSRIPEKRAGAGGPGLPAKTYANGAQKYQPASDETYAAHGDGTRAANDIRLEEPVHPCARGLGTSAPLSAAN